MKKLLPLIGAAILAFLAGTDAHSQVANGKVTTAAPTYTNGNVSPLSIDTTGNLRTVTGTGANAQQVQGNIASGATDSGNPVKSGAVFNTTPPTVTNGQRVDNQANNRGLLYTATSLTNAALAAAADAISNTSRVQLLDGSGAGLNGYMPMFPWVYNGTTWDRLRGDTTGLTLGSGGAANNIGITGQTQGSTTSGQRGDLVQGAVTTNNPAYTNAQTSPLNMTTAGNLRVVQAPRTISAARGGISTVTTTCTNVKASAGTIWGYTFNAGPSASNVAQFRLYDNASGNQTGTQIWEDDAYLTASIMSTAQMSFPVGLTFATGISACLTNSVAGNLGFSIAFE